MGLEILLVLPLIGIMPAVQPWLPSHLVTATIALIQGAPAADHLRTAAVTLLTIPALLGVSAWLLPTVGGITRWRRRESRSRR